MKKYNIHDLWLILGAYGVWFAIFSGIEEISNGKIWKASLSLLLGILVFVVIEKKLHNK